MAEAQTAIRVVPSGQIYRQMFDAQVQLVKTLDRSQRNAVQSDPTSLSVPVVHEDRAQMGKSLLKMRQVDWLESMPNDNQTENPVLFRHSMDKAIKEATEPESLVAAREVRCLANDVDVEKKGSDIIERIAESRRLRHESAVEDLHQELTLLANELEPRIIAAGEALLERLTDNDSVIDALLGRISEDDALKSYTLKGLEELWSDVEHQSTIRRDWIQDMDQKVETIEAERLTRIKDLLKAYAKNLVQIAYVMTPDVQRLIEREAQIINQTLLSNRRAYADLLARLLKTDIERDKNHRAQWESRVMDWRKLNTSIVIRNFTEYMHTPEITNPPVIDSIMAELMQDQKLMNQRRLELLNTLRSMKPPSSTKTAVYKWNKEIANVCQQIEKLHTSYLSRLHKEYELICKECLDQVERWRLDLLERGVCNEEKVQEVIERHFLPQVGDQQRIYEDNLENMDKSLEQLAESTAQQLRGLFKYAQGAAHLWDVHEINLAKKERELQEKLEECRHQHDNINQEMEANLDIILDRLRQESSKNALEDRSKKAFLMLDKIKESYLQFHKDQQSAVEEYPDMIRSEVARYDAAVCRFFDVDRLHPSERQKQLEHERKEEAKQRTKKLLLPVRRRTPLPQQGEHAGSPHDGGRSPSVMSDKSYMPNPQLSLRHVVKWKNVLLKRSVSGVSGKDSGTSAQSHSPVPMAVKEVVSTAKGTTFYVLTMGGEADLAEGDAGHDGDSAFLTEAGDEEEEMEKPVEYIRNVSVVESLFIELRKVLRVEFLNHLEEWAEQAIVRANSVVAAKKEELNSELDLRLHLHAPRSERTEKDIHNVRAAELLLHQDRINQHAKGVGSSLNEIKTLFTAMQHEHDQLVEKFQKEVDLMEGSFSTATKSATLLSLSQQVNTKVENHMEVIRASLRKFRQYLDDTLQMLRESNARFIKSFKLFTDGGNFSPEEIDSYKKRLEKLANKIDSAEGFVMADLEGMEARRLEQATDIASNFQDRFKSHLFDLTFIEKLTRWLTNTQVKIKGYVAESNSKAQLLMRHLNTLEKRVDACKFPNLDKEQITSDQLLASIPSIIEAFEERATFLNCRKTLTGFPSGLHPKMAAGGKVGFTTESKGQGSISQPGTGGPNTPVIVVPGQKNKAHAEDAAVSLIKNILKSQKTKGKGEDSDGDTDKPMSSGKPMAANQTSLLTEDGKGKGLLKPMMRSGDKDRLRPLVKRNTSLSLDSNPRRSASGVMKFKNTGLKWDPKYYIFGEKPEKDKYFLALIRRILQDSMDGLLSVADLYYKQKGNRQITRQQAIHDSFETCADVIVSKLQSYYTQADDYHNQCLQEFREQLERLETLVAEVPMLVLKNLLKIHLNDLREVMANQAEQFHNKYGQLERQRADHKDLLRPSLGHPQNFPQLQSLCDKEDSRRQEYEQGANQTAEDLNLLAQQLGESFVQSLSTQTEQLLSSMDSQLVVDDVEVGRVETKKLQTSALLRRKQAGQPLEAEDSAPLIQRGSRVWQGIPKNVLVAGERPSRPQLTPAITTQFTTLAHMAAVDTRDVAFKEYLDEFDRQLSMIERQRQEKLTAESRWSQSWKEAVQKVKKLY